MSVQAVFQPSAQSLARRIRIATVITNNKRIRPRVPFWQLAAHRVPTLWTLYRGLMRAAPSEDISFRVNMLFRKYQSLTSPTSTRQQLAKGHKWLDIFQRARAGDTKLQAILMRYSRMIASRREKEHWKYLIRQEVAWLDQLANRPILTGGPMKGSHYHGPLPRMKRQPHALSMMIAWRRKARARRTDQSVEMAEAIKDLRAEGKFEEALGRAARGVPKVFSGEEETAAWVRPIREKQYTVNEAFARDHARSQTPFPTAMLSQILAARRERIANHTRELERERRGELTNRALRRRRTGPPAHIAAIMSSKRLRLDKVARSLSEVGLAAEAKRKLGHKMKNPGKAKELEEGKKENRMWLKKMTEIINKENHARRMRATQKSD